MKKTNKKYVIFFVVILITSFFVFSYFLFNGNDDEDIVFNRGIASILDNYENDEKYFIEKKGIVKAGETLDLNIEYDFDKNEQKDYLVEFLFFKNKLSILSDDIIKKENKLNKYIYLTYLEMFSIKNDFDLNPQLLGELPYLGIIENEKNIYKFDENNTKNLPIKYFLLSELEKNGYDQALDLKKNIYDDLLEKFELLDYETKMQFLFYLSFNGDLNQFLNEKKVTIEDIPILVDYKSQYLYILNKINPENELVSQLKNNLKSDFDNISNEGKIIFLGFLNETIDKDFEKFDKKFGEIKDDDLNLDNLFKKFLIYSKFENNYTDYIKFWYSSGLMNNREKYFEIKEQDNYYKEIVPLNTIIYDNLIDTRVSSFEGKDFYIKVSIKEK